MKTNNKEKYFALRKFLKSCVNTYNNVLNGAEVVRLTSVTERELNDLPESFKRN